MVASVSASAPAGDAPVRFPDTRAARQPQLEKKREGAGEENANSNLLQARPFAALSFSSAARHVPDAQLLWTPPGCGDCHVPGRQVDVVLAQVSQVKGRG